MPKLDTCPKDEKHRCDNVDADVCCGGGADEPCDCIECHPTVIALPRADEWFYQHINIKEPVGTGVGILLSRSMLLLLDAYRKDVRDEINRAEKARAKERE